MQHRRAERPHYLLRQYTFEQMLNLHAQRHEWDHDAENLIRTFRSFSIVDEMPDPICLLGKDWDNMKIDLIEISKRWSPAVVIKVLHIGFKVEATINMYRF